MGVPSDQRFVADRPSAATGAYEEYEERMPSTSTPRDVLAAWGLGSATVVPVEGAEDRWRVESGAAPLLLRRYPAARLADAIAYEHDLLAFLAERSWPVPVPLAAAASPGDSSGGRSGDGDTVVDAAGARWALFPLLPGAPPPDESIFLQRRGALLALVHADLAAWDRAGHHHPFSRVDDFDTAVRAHGLASFEALLARVHAVDARRANALAVLRARVDEQLAAYGYARLPALPLWGACTADHVLFEGDNVTGLIEFDEARPDIRAVDIAASILADTRSVGWRIIRWIAGYSAHADPPLSEQDADLVPVAMAALTLRHAASRLAEAQATASLDERTLATVDEALVVEAHEADLRQVIRTAARLAPV